MIRANRVNDQVLSTSAERRQSAAQPLSDRNL